jgi:hypothetical protein
MPGRFRLILFVFTAVSCILLLWAVSASAQGAYIITLTSPDTSHFPHLTAYLDVHDQAGGFVHGLTIQDVTVQENGVQLLVSELEENKPGVQFVVAITPGATFNIRDAAGISRYEYLLEGMLAGTWVSQSGGDDLSLVTPDGSLLAHSSDPAALRSAFESYQPSSNEAAPNLEVLASALQLAADPTPHPGMERAILYITPPQPADVSPGLQSIMANANQQNIHIFVWMVASQEVFASPETDLLRNLASQTHAAYFEFSHSEPVPDLNSMLEPLRYVYQVGYDSHATTAGAQQVVAQVTLGSEVVVSPPLTFELNLLAPSVVILNPPAVIERKFLNLPTPVSDQEPNDLRPAEQQVDIQVSFPDGHVRPLASTRLFVDGAMVAEATSPPFEQLIWDLHPYVQEGTHILKVEATDNLGRVGQSNEISVKITVPSNTQAVAVAVSHNRILVIGLTVFTSAAILVLVLIVGGRIRPRPFPGQARSSASSMDKTRQVGYWQRLRQLKDPVTQPVKIGSALPAKNKSIRMGWIGRLPWRRQKEPVIVARAYLVPLVGADEPTIPALLQITTDSVTLGSDPQKASLVILHPSIQGVHARISQEGKSFLITDAGSIAGTWVNYEQAASNGTKLKHADIIHLGRVGFRFTLPDPGTPPKVVVTPLEPDS